jgi:hypothetical protein
MFPARLTALRNTLLRTFPLSAVGWLGVEFLRGAARGRITYREDAGLRFLVVWWVAIFWSFPADRGHTGPIPHRTARSGAYSLSRSRSSRMPYLAALE